MNLDGVLDLLGSIVTVALVSTILMRGSQFAQIITSFGSAFSDSLRAARG